ncbi:unnamed protein product [Schistosoma mattheei]|uniref:Uncharacterized protein n=1 Tax=Schistosoma mattheei TaxID=31246 RepID=A0A183NJP1_9TREM|nr:unnamed protein product [Schistosoma mattheei]
MWLPTPRYLLVKQDREYYPLKQNHKKQYNLLIGPKDFRSNHSLV